MRKVSFAALGLFLVLGTVATASAAINIDGYISDGEWNDYISIDPDDQASNNIEMTRWGAKVEDGYLNFFCEIDDSQAWTDFQAASSSSSWPPIRAAFPALWIDADSDGGGQPGNTGTFSASGSIPNCADDDKKEWSTNHRGIDLFVGLGLVNNWTNGSPTAPNGFGSGHEVFNIWGSGDDIGSINTSCTSSDSDWIVNGNVLEARVLMMRVAIALANNGETIGGGVSIGDYMTVSLGVEGYIDGGATTWGYDVGTPTVIASNPTGKELLPGDFNLDGVVDVSDLGILASNYGGTTAMTWGMGDATKDHVVDDSDLDALATNYGSVAGFANVPEPTTLSLLGFAALSLLLWRRKK